MKRTEPTNMLKDRTGSELKVILDSNAFFVPLQFKIDIFDALSKLLNRNYEPLLLSVVKKELETISKRSLPAARSSVSLALQFAEKCKYVKVEDTKKATTDDVIFEVAKKWKAAVFTNDKQLHRRLRDINVPVIYVRQKSRLEIDGMI